MHWDEEEEEADVQKKKKTHSSFLYSFVEQLDDVHSLHATSLEALRPCYQKALHTNRRDSKWKSVTKKVDHISNRTRK